MRLIDPKKIPKMGEPTTLEDAPMYEFAQCLVDYLVENYGVDVPDTVRCEECVFWNRYDNVQVIGSCNRYGGIYNKRETDFCSWGERKGDEENKG